MEGQTAHAGSQSYLEHERTAILDQLNRILASSHFRSSKRYPAFLRYVVLRTLEGNGELLKERTLGVEVFGRPPEYDTNADPVVRATAGEVRKRLAQYYYERRNVSEVQIELPSGSYVAEFQIPETKDGAAAPPEDLSIRSPEPKPTPDLIPPKQIPTETDEPSVKSRLRSWSLQKQWQWILSVSVVLLTIWAIPRWWPHPSAMTRFWAPVLNSSSPVMVCVGQLYAPQIDLHPDPSRSRFGTIFPLLPAPAHGNSVVALSDATTTANVAGLLKSLHRDILIRGKDATTFADLQNGPVVLVGGFSNDWVIRLTDSMRYHFDMNPALKQWWIADAEKPGTKLGLHWTEVPESAAREDYAIVARVFSQDIDQPVVILAGVETYGTLVAGDFVTKPAYLKEFAEHAPRGWEHKNMELVIATTVVNGNSGPPRVIASAFW